VRFGFILTGTDNFLQKNLFAILRKQRQLEYLLFFPPDIFDLITFLNVKILTFILIVVSEKHLAFHMSISVPNFPYSNCSVWKTPDLAEGQRRPPAASTASVDPQELPRGTVLAHQAQAEQ
jgi:hypothetical protein